METKELKVNQISLYREIARNLVNPLEVVREAISNTHDAAAQEISIRIFRNEANQFCIEFADDGDGMGEKEFERFFNLGDSLKAQNNIGQKGLGTKTFFRSGRLIVESQPRLGNKRYRAILDEPWDKLNHNELPTYTLSEIDVVAGNPGTIITLIDYKIDNPERIFHFRRLKDYILWFTAAGSFKTKFSEETNLRPYIQNIHISPHVLLDDQITREKEYFAGGHRFPQPNENPKPELNEQEFPRSNYYCKHFGPYHNETQISGKYVSFQLYGTISGIRKREEVSSFYQGETHKSRFGLYFCKDFIPIVNKAEFLKDPNYQHYHLLLNSQNFELTADRNNISNEDSPEVKWVLEEAYNIIEQQIKPIALQGFFQIRAEEEVTLKQKKRAEQLVIRMKEYKDLPPLNALDLPIVKIPTNEAQVAVLFSALIAKGVLTNFKIGTYSDKSTTDLICENKDGEPFLVELEYKLSNLFFHGHAYETFDKVVCWSVDLEVNERRDTPEHITLKLVKDNDKWFLKYGPTKTIEVIELKPMLMK